MCFELAWPGFEMAPDTAVWSWKTLFLWNSCAKSSTSDWKKVRYKNRWWSGLPSFNKPGTLNSELSVRLQISEGISVCNRMHLHTIDAVRHSINSSKILLIQHTWKFLYMKISVRRFHEYKQSDTGWVGQKDSEKI